MRILLKHSKKSWRPVEVDGKLVGEVCVRDTYKFRWIDEIDVPKEFSTALAMRNYIRKELKGKNNGE